MTSRWGPRPQAPARAATRLLQALALTLALSTFAAGLHDVSRAWDVWYYHLPFAARLAGAVALPEVQADLVTVIGLTLEPAHLSVWLPEGER